MSTPRDIALALPLGDGTNLTDHQRLSLMHLTGRERHARATAVYTNVGVLRAAYAYLQLLPNHVYAAAHLSRAFGPKLSSDRAGEQPAERRKRDRQKRAGTYIYQRATKDVMTERKRLAAASDGGVPAGGVAVGIAGGGLGGGVGAAQNGGAQLGGGQGQNGGHVGHGGGMVPALLIWPHYYSDNCYCTTCNMIRASRLQ